MRDSIVSPETLRHLRRRLRLSQTRFGKRLGVTRATVARWEAGVVRIPYAASLLIAAWEEEVARTGIYEL